MPSCPTALRGVAAGQDAGNGAKKYMKIQAGGDAPNQQQIQAFSSGVIEPAAAPDLPQTSQSRPYRQDFVRRRSIVFLVLPERNGARPDERHLPADNVNQLRKFIEGMTPAERCKTALDAGVGAAFRCGNVAGNALDGESSGRGASGVPHRSKLQHGQWAALPADPVMSYQWIAPREHENSNPDHNYYGRKNEQRYRRDDAFHGEKQPVGARGVGTTAAAIRLLLFLIAFLFQASLSHSYPGGDTQ
jgi:hypothetical protein